MMKKNLGLIVNPIAGMGGKVGLKGSDGKEILQKAISLGAVPQSPARAILALEKLKPIRDRIQIITYPGQMGENEAKSLGFHTQVIGSIVEGQTTPEDTENAAKEMLKRKVDLILFAGGDGTARNLYNAVGDQIPVLGIPAGVKIHSGVYANTPANAGNLAAKFLSEDRKIRLKEAEVMDIDEEAFRQDRVSARLYGYMKIPFERNLVQSAKAGSAPGEAASVESIASHVVQNMEKDCLYIIGPGTTTRGIMEMLGLPNTLLGVDVVCNKQLVASDANEEMLLKIVDGRKAKIVVTIIGGQGYIFGRGNQQISHKVLRSVGIENILVISTESKLLGLKGSPLLVDTGDLEMDKKLAGYKKVITGLNKYIAYKVAY